MKVRSADGLVKTKQGAGKRVQATSTTSIPPLSRPASAMKVRSAGVVKTKQVPGKRVQATSTTSIPPLSRLSSAMKVRSAGVVKTKQVAGKRVQATSTTSIPPLSRPSSAMKVPSAGVVSKEAHGVTKTKQEEASMTVQATAARSIPHPAPSANHLGPHAAQDALRAALAAAHEARERRQQNVYREQREQARRELDKVVQTVFFNDPYLTLDNAIKTLMASS